MKSFFKYIAMINNDVNFNSKNNLSDLDVFKKKLISHLELKFFSNKLYIINYECCSHVSWSQKDKSDYYEGYTLTFCIDNVNLTLEMGSPFGIFNSDVYFVDNNIFSNFDDFVNYMDNLFLKNHQECNYGKRCHAFFNEKEKSIILISRDYDYFLILDYINNEMYNLKNFDKLSEKRLLEILDN